MPEDEEQTKALAVAVVDELARRISEGVGRSIIKQLCLITMLVILGAAVVLGVIRIPKFGG